MNYQHLHFQFPAKPFQRWHVIEDRTAPRGLRFRHARQPGEKPDPKVNFGVEELSARLEHAGVEYLRIALGNDASSFERAHVLLTDGLKEEGPGDGHWFPVIPWVRDDGFYAVCLREPMLYQDACRLFGFDIPAGKPSVPKRIKRDVARGKTSLFGELLETRELNEWDLLHTVMLADGKTTFEVATYNPSNRWPEAWTSGAALASPRGGAILTGHPVKIGDLIQITGAMPNGQIKGNCLIWDIDHDLVVWDVKSELRAWQGHIYLSVLNELHGGPANLDVQTASNLDLAKVRDHKLIQFLCQQYACDVFDLMRDDDRVKEEIGFYNPAAWVDEDGNPVINENRWKLWRMYSAGLPAMQFRTCRDAFYRTQMESPENNDPDRFRIRFREPQDLMTVQSNDLAGAAVRRYLFPEPFVFDKRGYPYWDRSTLPDVDSVYLGGFDGEFISLRNPNASHKESGKLRGAKLQHFAAIDRGAVMFVHLGFAASPEGAPGMAKSFNGADFDDSVLALLDPEIVQHWNNLPAYPWVAATPTEVTVIDDGDDLFDRQPKARLYDWRYVSCMVQDAKRGQTGIGYVVNAITWFNLLWLHRESIVAELRAMQPSLQVAEAIRWMEQELPESRMPMVASRLEEIIDALKMNGKSIDWANEVITEFRQSCPVAPKFWWQGGYQSQGRIPRDRIANGNEPIPVTTAMDVAREQWIEIYAIGRDSGDELARVLGERQAATIGPVDSLFLAQQLCDDGMMLYSNAHRFWNDPGVMQGIWDLRDSFKATGRMLVLLAAPGATLPQELGQDVLILDEPLPSATHLEQIVRETFDAANLSDPEPPVVVKAVDALIGLAAFPAEQALAISLVKRHLDTEDLWERKRQIIEQTPGLSVWRGGETFEDIGGVENAKSFLRAVLAGIEPPRVVVFIDEIEKAFAGTGTDLSGVKTEMTGTILTYMQDREADGLVFVGPAGAAKSAAAKATGGTAGIPTIAFDLPAMESSLVGASTERLRTALQIIDAVSQGRMLFIATCNSIASLPPELRRRFTLGTFFFDLPTADERETIWRIYLKKYGVSGELPNDEGWTGAEIKECCRKAHRLGITLAQASRYIVPVARSAAEQIKALRQMASGKFISASSPGVYRYEEETAAAGRRVIRDLGGPLTVMPPSKSEV